MTTRFTLLLLAALALSGTAAAQDHSQRAHHVIQVPDQLITGRRQLPLQILLSRARVDFSGPELQTSFVREIVRTGSH